MLIIHADQNNRWKLIFETFMNTLRPLWIFIGKIGTYPSMSSLCLWKATYFTVGINNNDSTWLVSINISNRRAYCILNMLLEKRKTVQRKESCAYIKWIAVSSYSLLILMHVLGIVASPENNISSWKVFFKKWWYLSFLYF